MSLGITRAVERRMGALAELVANGATVADAGRQLELTKGETANVWRHIKAQLGCQAC